MFVFLCCWVVALVRATDDFDWLLLNKTRIENCVVGAGAAGLQLAYFFAKDGDDDSTQRREAADRENHRRQECDGDYYYLVFEKSDSCGSFFKTFPKARRLISINKVFTGTNDREFNLRHDWNSLLTTEYRPLFTNYSSEYYPHPDDIVRYFNDFRRMYDLRVALNSAVVRIERADGRFRLIGRRDAGPFEVRCQRVFVGGGNMKAHIPKSLETDSVGAALLDGYESLNMTDVRRRATNTSVLILGKGNSAFETALDLTAVAARVHVVGRSLIRFAWQTHYVGDLRALNNDILDHYQLKSLDAIAEIDVNSLRFRRSNCTVKLVCCD
jgi:cation diffusion facilitator CzcD-associated flavoprotein CzcO